MNNSSLNYEECIVFANAIPMAEHTRLRTLEDLKNSEDSVVSKFNKARKKTGVLLSTRISDETNELVTYFAKKLTHTLVIGSSGSGKSQGFGMNTLMNLDGTISYIVADPKGEYYRNTYSRLAEVYGSESVKCIDFMNPALTDYHINHLYVLAIQWLKVAKSKKTKGEKKVVLDHIVGKIKKYYDVLFTVKSIKDPSWEETAKNFILAITYALFEDLTLTNSKAKRTRRCRTTPDVINFTTINKIFQSFTWENSRSSFNDGGFLTNRGKDSLAYRYSNAIINNASGTRANYMGFVANYLKEIDDARIAHISAYNDFDVSSLGRKPQIIFFIYDISDVTIRDYVNKVIAQNISELLEYTHRTVKPLDVPVVYYIDEFPTLLPSSVFPNILATGRGSNIFLQMVIQSYSQLQARYPDEYRAMLENCDYTFFIGTNDADTAKKFSDELGKRVVPDPAAFLQGNFITQTVPVVSEDYLMHRMEDGEVFIKVHRKQPIHGFFQFFYKTDQYKSYSVTDRSAKEPDCKPAITYDAPWLHPDEDDDEDFFNDMRFSKRRRNIPFDEEDDFDDNTSFEDDEDEPNTTDEDELAQDEKIPSEGVIPEDKADLDNLYPEGFDVVAEAVCVSKSEIDRALAIPYKKDLSLWASESEFENIVMTCIEKVVAMNKDWARMDAVMQAAKELAAVCRCCGSNKKILDVHTRMLHEFKIATDEEYLLLRKQIWGN